MIEPASEAISKVLTNKIWTEDEIRRSNYEGMLIKIRRNKIMDINSSFYFETRNESMLNLVERALKQGEVADCSFIISTNDFASEIPQPQFAFCEHENDSLNNSKYKRKTILCPDFSFSNIGWPEANTGTWEQMCELAEKKSVEYPFDVRKPQLMFRGNLETNPIRKEMREWSTFIPELDVQHTDCHDLSNMVRLEDHCKWKYLYNLPGRSYSGRFKYLFLTSSTVVWHNNGYKEWWHGLLDSDCVIEHGSNIKPDDIKQIVYDLNENPEKAERIGKKGNERIKQITSDVVDKYWYELLSEYSSHFY